MFIIVHYLLQNNTVSYFTFPTSFQLKTLFFTGSRVSHRDSSLLFIQILTTLNLGSNKIGVEGAQAIGQALQTNKVTKTMILFNFYHIHLSLFTQTLTTLNLRGNQIGVEGVEAIGQALKTNKVTQTMIFFNFYHIHLSLFI